MKTSLNLSRQQVINLILQHETDGIGIVILNDLLDKAEAAEAPCHSSLFNPKKAESFLADIRAGHCTYNRKIEFIKRCRETFPGIGLAAAKYMVEDLVKGAGATAPF